MSCDFSSVSRRAYLDRWDTCDVQAAPGSGKTTLLVAKLAHLCLSWPFVQQGACVLSHTNVAREEIQQRLARIPEAARLLVYPNFVGTLTTFFHTFLAFPLLRGLGWPMTCIDDDAFTARILALAQKKKTVRGMLRSAKTTRGMQGWLSELTIADDFAITEASPSRIRLAPQSRMPGPDTASGGELQELKAELISNGFYRYADMLVLARRALNLVPDLAQRIATRFPLVFVDEAQDTSAPYLQLIEQVFGSDRSAVQRLGDCNQGILGGDDTAGSCWRPAATYIDLGESLRLSSVIADFASKITCHQPQAIDGRGSPHNWPLHVMLVEPGSETAVGRHFAHLVAAKFLGHDAPEVWAVGWIHKLSESQNALRLSTYFPSYRRPGADGHKTLLAVLQEYLVRHSAADSVDLDELVDIYARQIRFLLSAHVSWKELPSIRQLWRWLDESRRGSAADTRSVLLRVVAARGQVAPAEWENLTQQLRKALHPKLPQALALPALESLLAYADSEETAILVDGADDARKESHEINGQRVCIRLGTVASVKGRTHDATLVVQTTMGSVKDMCSALEMATGKSVPSKPNVLRAVMNAFVAATRPRHLLCFALTKDARVEKLRPKLEAQGMVILEVS